VSFARPHAVPLAAGLAAAVVAFAVVAATSDGGGLAAKDSGARPAPGAAQAAVSPPATPAPTASSAHATGLEVFTRLGCGGCHRLAAANSTGPIGPNLDDRLPHHTRDSLTAQILSPSPGTVMPPGLGARMSAAELDALLDFLLSVREPR
jgi:cytochrome c oxidase subunit 2